MKKFIFVLAAAIATIMFFNSYSSAMEMAPTGWGKDFSDAVSQGDAYFVKCEYARALESYEHAEELAPHAAQASYKIALTMYRWGNGIQARREDLWPLAIKKVERTLYLDPTFADAVFLLGVLRYRMGDFKSAVQIYKSISEIRQGDPDLYMDIAVAAWRAGDMKLSSAALERARALTPSSTRLHSIAREIFSSR